MIKEGKVMVMKAGKHICENKDSLCKTKTGTTGQREWLLRLGLDCSIKVGIDEQTHTHKKGFAEQRQTCLTRPEIEKKKHIE